MTNIVVVGAGISGLALAYRLEQALPDAVVTVLERNSRPGGAAWTERDQGFQLEIGPNGFLDNKESTLNLCWHVGLGDELLPASESAGKYRYLYLDGRLRLLPHSLGTFLGTDLLSWRGKVSLLAERFRGRRRETGEESIAAFVRRRAGAEAARIFADALVTGIHAGDPELLSVQAAFPRLVQLEGQYGSVLKGLAQSARQRRQQARARGEQPRRPGRMWSFLPGIRLLIETLCSRLRTPPLFGIEVKRVARHDGRWAVWSEDREPWLTDAVALTCPAYQQAALLADLDPPLADLAAGIAYVRVAVIGLGYRWADMPLPLEGFGYIAPQGTRRDLLGVQWCSSIFPGRAPADAVLLRAMAGGWHRPEIVGRSDSDLLHAARTELRRTMGIAAEPIFQRIIRWDRAIPQYLLGHLERLRQMDERLLGYPGLFLGGNAYRGIAFNDCTEQAEILATRIHAYLKKPGG